MVGYGQTHLESVIEATINIVVGLGLSLAGNWAYLAWCGFDVNWHQMSGLAVFMTVISFVRSLTLRRVFNAFYLRRLRHEGKAQTRVC